MVLRLRKIEKGLTLVELLIAVSLMVVAIVIIGGGFNFINSAAAFAQNKVSAVHDAEKVMEEVRRVADDVGLTGTGSVSDANYWTAWIAAQSFSSLPGQSISVTFPDGTSGDPLKVLVAVQWTEKSATSTYQLYNKVTRRT